MIGRQVCSWIGPGLMAALAVGCTVQDGAAASLKSGNGISIDSSKTTISVDSSKVPVVDSCPAGGQVSKGANGWECTAAPTWSTIAPTVSTSTAWPGTIPYSQVTGAPADLAALAGLVSDLQGQVAALQAAGKPALFTGLDTAPVVITGNSGFQTLSTFNFQSVPAGNVAITATINEIIGGLDDAAGYLAILYNGHVIAQGNSNLSGQSLANSYYIQRTLLGNIQSFPGGNLTLVLGAKGAFSDYKVTFGTNGDVDGTFGRSINVIAGLN